jgi:2'-5' RNA ligase
LISGKRDLGQPLSPAGMTSGSETPRLFVAVWPPAPVVAALAALPRGDAPGVVWEPPDLAHVTLRYLGPCEVEAAVAAMTRLRASAATAVLGPAVVMLGPSVVCVPAAGLDHLASDVLAVTAGLGQPPTHDRFTGHLTVARVRRNASCTLVGYAVAGSFDVTSVALVRSHLSNASQPVRRYETLATFAVGGTSTSDP